MKLQSQRGSEEEDLESSYFETNQHGAAMGDEEEVKGEPEKQRYI